MKIVLAGGGTGGHVYPAVAIANELRRNHEDWVIEFVGRKESLEGKAVPQAGYTIHHLYVTQFERDFPLWETIKVAARLLISMKDAFKLIRKLKPDVVIGTGGYICGPIVLAGALKKIPSLICEQNVIVGFTIKTLSKYANTVCLAFDEARSSMHHPERCVLTGNPIRREFEVVNKETARKTLRLDESKRVLLSFGGSRGAKSINDSIRGLIDKFKDNKDFVIYHITGKDTYDEFLEEIRSDGIDLSLYPNINILSYADDMPTLLNASDLVISRSGAMSISEINYVGVAAIYVPYPFAASDHQTKNALVPEKAGAAIMIKDDELDVSVLISKVNSILFNDSVLKKMAEKASELGIKNSVELICKEVEVLVENKNK